MREKRQALKFSEAEMVAFTGSARKAIEEIQSMRHLIEEHLAFNETNPPWWQGVDGILNCLDRAENRVTESYMRGKYVFNQEER